MAREVALAGVDEGAVAGQGAGHQAGVRQRTDAQRDIVATRFVPPLSTDAHGQFHALGTDRFGRDVWTRLVYGARVSLSVGVVAVLLSIVLGVFIGAVAGFWRGPISLTLLGVTDFALALPRLVLLLLLAALWRPNTALVIAVLGLTGWMSIARLVHAFQAKAALVLLPGKERLAREQRGWIAARGDELDPRHEDARRMFLAEEDRALHHRVHEGGAERAGKAPALGAHEVDVRFAVDLRAAEEEDIDATLPGKVEKLARAFAEGIAFPSVQPGDAQRQAPHPQ